MLQTFDEYISECCTPCILPSDKGTKYTHKNFLNLTATKSSESTPFVKPKKKNGVAGKANSCFKIIRIILIESQLHKSYWLRAEDTVDYVGNLVKKVKEEKIQHKKLRELKFKTDPLKIFGCLANVRNRKVENK